MADFPVLVKPAFITPFRVPGAIGSVGQTGKVQLRSAIGMGREWDMTWNPIQVGTPNVDALLAFIEDAWSQGKTFDLSHPYTPGSGLAPHGVGGGTPLVNGASQTGASLITDGWGSTGGTNPADNPGFESGSLSPHVTIAAGGAWSVDTVAPRTGTYAAQYSPTGQTGIASIAFTSASVPNGRHPAVAGRRYTVEFWSRRGGGAGAGDGNGVAGNLAFYSSSGFISQSTGTTVVNSNIYQRIAHSAVAPANTAFVEYRGMVENDAIALDTYIDDAFIFTNVMDAGDVFKIGGLPQLFRVTGHANMDTAGNATIPISPPIVAGGSPANNAVITRTGAKLTAYVASPPNLPNVPPGRWWAGLTVTFREAL